MEGLKGFRHALQLRAQPAPAQQQAQRFSRLGGRIKTGNAGCVEGLACWRRGKLAEPGRHDRLAVEIAIVDGCG
ncbi:hypothetical protein D3C87_1693870 [compost metagenome]